MVSHKSVQVAVEKKIADGHHNSEPHSVLFTYFFFIKFKPQRSVEHHTHTHTHTHVHAQTHKQKHYMQYCWNHNLRETATTLLQRRCRLFTKRILALRRTVLLLRLTNGFI